MSPKDQSTHLQIKDLLRWNSLYIFIYSAISIVILWNLLLPGYIFTLDMIFAPNYKFPSTFYGPKPGFTILVDLLLHSASYIAPPWLLQKIIMFLILSLAGISCHRLCPTERLPGKYFAGLIYMLNPFVYTRFMVGQWTLLLAYALTPFVVKTMIDFFKEPNFQNSVKVSLLISLVAIFSTQILFLLILVFLVFLITNLIRLKKPVTLFKHVGIISGSFILLNIYWIAPAITATTPPLAAISYQDILAFSARNWGTGFNILFSLASMYGFWRLPEQYTYVSNVLPYWYILFFFILFLAVHGFSTKFKDSQIGRYVKSIGILAGISLVLSTGISSPYFSEIFTFLFDNIFFFSGFRDSQKLILLLILAYAYLGGLGIDDLTKKVKISRADLNVKQIAAIFLVIIAIISPFVYSFNMLGGFNGQLTVKDYPEDWYQVDDYLNQQEGDFNILFFPWHQYMAFHWSERIIGNPRPKFL
ncbi:MAG: hypothetical protein ABIH76_08275 [Candidatus Bathyarchaeota archaeon]